VLRLFDTASASVRPLEPRDPGRIAMYVCGPTVYGDPHIGHGRFSLVFDLIRRYLVFSGYEVHYVSNITDIDDNIIHRATVEGTSESDVVERYEAAWWKAMDALGVLRPDDVPHATAYVDRMVELIGQLVERDLAYQTTDGVYLAVELIEGYGLLNHQPLESLRAGARVESVEEKRSPLDFVLWKKAKPGEPTWPSPWGPGRPGWHTECVVMSLDLLGPGFDLHGGAIDLIFPHHENERAQAVALGTPFARHWVHNGWVMVGSEKMSKSLGNFTTLDELLARSDGRAYRLLVLQAHYRSPIEVTPDTVAQAERALDRLDALARRFSPPDPFEPGRHVVLPDAVADSSADAVRRFRAAMDDDLDSPAAMAVVFELVTEAHRLGDDGRVAEASVLATTVAVLCGAVGLVLAGPPVAPDEDVARLVAERDHARAARDWARADAIRDELTARGFVVEDSPEGTRIR
jgi:cysteinyl-tRNA synthetase